MGEGPVLEKAPDISRKEEAKEVMKESEFLTSFLRLRKEEKQEAKREAEHSLLFLGAQREKKDKSKIYKAVNLNKESVGGATELYFLLDFREERKGKLAFLGVG